MITTRAVALTTFSADYFMDVTQSPAAGSADGQRHIAALLHPITHIPNSGITPAFRIN